MMSHTNHFRRTAAMGLALLLATFSLPACSQTSEQQSAGATSEAAAPTGSESGAFPEITSAADFVASRDSNSVLLDVRTPSEYESGHLDNAVLMDVLAGDFEARIADLDTSKTFYVYCRSGNRSGQAADILRANGFTRVTNIGGFGQLVNAGAPVAQ